MTGFLAFLVVAGGLAVIMGGLARLASRVRRRGIGGGLMDPFEEMWHPAGHRYRAETEAHEERVVSMPSPDDQWPGEWRRGD